MQMYWEDLETKPWNTDFKNQIDTKTKQKEKQLNLS